ncbi:hypothetical protein M5W68_05140 [Paenibacillus larvae]|uniref:hypothetical protein n=1 Tax=Paenibacillus larvae TaxID=1464 RepID=UPI00227F124C|nr:hypothetical protein [Paenibacillus larvae]MCY9511567.1 hypothetical protein [Paenibacillus larvae]MCY9524549.1 hypothetical protein [Paenibacillus larvae]
MLRYILEQSACFEGIMCYTAEEASFLAGKKFNDLLVAYPVWEEAHISALVPYWQKGQTKMGLSGYYPKAAGSSPSCVNL